MIKQVVDTAEFQRLRDIIQTSYSPLYSSALHNRFVHSIGVHHLGRIAAEAFRKSVIVRSLKSPEMIERYIEPLSWRVCYMMLGMLLFLIRVSSFIYIKEIERSFTK